MLFICYLWSSLAWGEVLDFGWNKQPSKRDRRPDTRADRHCVWSSFIPPILIIRFRVIRFISGAGWPNRSKFRCRIKIVQGLGPKRPESYDEDWG